MLLSDPRYETYGHIIASENEFWVAYNGYKLEKGKPPSTSEKYAKRIFCFDWQGKPLRKLEFDYPFLAFDVNWNAKVLFSLEWENENPEIVSYQLNDILE